MAFNITNTSNGLRVISDLAGRHVKIQPGQTKRVNLSPEFAERMKMRHGSLRIAVAGEEDKDAPSTSNINTKAARALADNIESGDLSLYIGRKQAAAFFGEEHNVPTVKSRLIEALREV